MKPAEIWLICITLAALSLFALLIFSSLVRITPPMPPAAVAGSKLWREYGCMECHSLLSSGGYSALDLTKIISQRTEAELRQFFAQPPPMPPHSRRTHVGLTAEESEKMLAFLRYVNTIDTRNWPPPPLVEEKRSKERQNR